MNIQLVNSLVEIVSNLSAEERELFEEKLENKRINTGSRKPLTSEEKLSLWREWVNTEAIIPSNESVPDSNEKQNPWWLKVAGSFENDSTFDAASYLGREWRESAE
jgi:hypothetical protein